MNDERDQSEPPASDLSAHERALFAALPRESALDADATGRLMLALRHDGIVRRRAPATRWAIRLAAAVTLFLAGAFAGQRYAMRNSLERALARTDLTVSDRVLLLQRAGSAYVTAANAYADATQRADSSAVEVANQVLRGAAHAMVRGNLNNRTADDLLRALHARDTTTSRLLLWY